MSGIVMQNKFSPNGRAVESSSLLGAKAEWISLHNNRLAKIQAWQRPETQLFTQAKQKGIPVEASLASDQPEAQAMKTLDKRIEELSQQTDDLAEYILSKPIGSLAEAVAKIEVGLKIQGAEDWQPYALELIEDALDALNKQFGCAAQLPGVRQRDCN